MKSKNNIKISKCVWVGVWVCVGVGVGVGVLCGCVVSVCCVGVCVLCGCVSNTFSSIPIPLFYSCRVLYV